MRIRLILDDRGEVEPEVLFHGIPNKSLWGSFSFSLWVHVVVVWLGVSYLHFLAMLPAEPARDLRQARVLDLNADPIQYPSLPAPAEPAQPAPREKNLAKRAPASKPVEAQAAPSAPPAPAQAAREFRMPPLPEKHTAPQTLVQLDLPPTMEVRQELRVPQLVMLAAIPRHVAPKPFVAPPERKNTMEVPSHVVLEMRPPVLDLHPGFAKTPEVLSEVTPRLAAPVGAVAPVASNREPVEVKPAASTATGNVPAEPANVISLPDRPIPGASAIVLPPLNQVSSRDSASGLAGPSDPAGKALSGRSGAGEVASASSSENSDGGSGGPGAGHGASTASLAGNGSGNSPASHSTGAGAGTAPGRAATPGGSAAGLAAGSSNGSANEPGTGSGAAGGKGSSSTTTRPPVRLIRPQEGHYEIAIVQSSGVVPGSAGLLKGRPVFSVYVPVGTSKEWILQYCLPADEAHQTAPSQVVSLGTVTPIGAPYAFTIIGPVVQLRSGARYGFIHGFVNASGRFEKLAEASDPVIENLDTVLQCLQQWEFRPATKDGVPTVVEVLLCIPNAA